MTSDLLSLAKYLASSRTEFALSEMNQYLSRQYEEKQLYELLKPHFYDLGLFCDTHNCKKLVKHALPADASIIKELDRLFIFKTPQLPTDIEKLISSYIERSCGKDWHTGEKARLLRENIVKQKEEYWTGSSKYPKIRVISYLLYHFPVYFVQFQYLLLDLFKNGLLTSKMSILDAGSGSGTITLSTMDFLNKLQGIYSKRNLDVKMNIKIDSIEKGGENINCYDELTSSYLSALKTENVNFTITRPVPLTIEKTRPPQNADLIIFSNVLAEMRASSQERATVVEKIASASKDATVMIVEPADLVNSKALRVAQNSLIKKGFTVFGPCTRIWGLNCSGENCWSFYDPGNIQAPEFMKKIARTEESYRFMNTDMKFSYVILRKDGLEKQTYRAKGKFVRLSNLKKHIGKRINVIVSVMSGNLGDEHNFVFKICDGTTSIPCYAVIPAYHRKPDNKAVFDARYADIVEISGALVRENREYSSYNLLITRSTAVIEGNTLSKIR